MSPASDLIKPLSVIYSEMFINPGVKNLPVRWDHSNRYQCSFEVLGYFLHKKAEKGKYVFIGNKVLQKTVFTFSS